MKAKVKEALGEWHSITDEDLEFFQKWMTLGMLIWIIAETVRLLA